MRRLKYNENQVFFGDMRLEKYTYDARKYGQGARAPRTCFARANEHQKNEGKQAFPLESEAIL